MHSKQHKIAIIGDGNVSFHLVRWFKTAGVLITSIYKRNPEKDNVYRTDLNYSGENCDFIILAVKDDVIPSVLDAIQNTGDAILLHTSGTVNINVFTSKGFSKYGVLYPLQTLQREKEIPIENVPFLIEGGNEEALLAIKNLCIDVKMVNQSVSSTKRLKYHLAAVIASNFSNHLLLISNQILQEENESIHLLEPLLQETMRKAFDIGPHASQTGPARRNDGSTMKKHIDLLTSDRHKEIYRLISQSIVSIHQQEE